LQTAILKEASDSIKMILRLIEKSGDHEVLEETNKIGLSALLIAIRTGQQDVRSTVTIATIIIVIIIILIFIISNYTD